MNNITNLVEGMVGAQNSQDEVPPTVTSVFDQLVDPIGVEQPHIHSIPRSTPTVGSEPVPVGLQTGVTDPDRGNAVFSDVFGAPDFVEGAVFRLKLRNLIVM